MVAEPRRTSQTLLKPAAGFQPQLLGWDLATLLQMASARPEPVVVRVRCERGEGYVYIAEGRLVHAVQGALTGEPAVASMLAWHGGELAFCERPWPANYTIHSSTEAVLIRAAQAEDESSIRPSELRPARPSSRPAASAFGGPRALSAEHTPPTAAPRVDPASTPEGPMVASVRIDMNGEVVAQQGGSEALASLVGYVTRMGALLGAQLGLEPFEALSADVGPHKVLVFVEGEQMVGLLLAPGALYQELRQQLGV